MATHIFEIQGMHCGSCALLVDDTLEDLPGVRTTQTSKKKGRATVELDPDLNSPGDIVTAIAELGYTAVIVE